MIEWTQTNYTVYLNDNNLIVLVVENSDKPEQYVMLEILPEIAKKIGNAMVKNAEVAQRKGNLD